jgi:hypothetical protein
MKLTTKNYVKVANAFDIEAHIITCDVSYRGGILKVDVSELFPTVGNTDYEESEQVEGEPIMGASQNYLGGGMAGSITGGAMFEPRDLKTKAEKLLFQAMLERCKHYFYSLNEGGGDEYMHEHVTGPDAGGYDRVQMLPESAL